MQLDVNRQLHRIAWRGRLAGELAGGATTSGGFDRIDPGDAMQLGLETLLDTEFADVFCAAVVGRVVRLFEFLFLGGVDPPDVANHMAGEFAVGVIAEQPGLDVDPGKTVALRGKAGHLLIAQAGAKGQ